MTDAMPAMIEAGDVAAREWEDRNGAPRSLDYYSTVYLSMEAARIPAAPGDVDHSKLIALLQTALGGESDCWSTIRTATLERVIAALSTIPIPAPTGEVGRLRKALEEADLRACMIAEAIMNGCSSQKAIDELQGLQRKVVAALTDHTTKDDE